MKIGEQPLTIIQSSKSRGVVFDQHLVWEEHVDSLCKRVSSGLAALKQSGQYVPQDRLLSIYNAVIIPLFDCCDVVWGNLKKPQRRDSKSSKIEKSLSNRHVQSYKQQSSNLLIKSNSSYVLREGESRLLLPKY